MDLLKVQHFKVLINLFKMNKLEKFVVFGILVIGLSAILYVLVEMLKGNIV